jgi:hypothetical protein
MNIFLDDKRCAPKGFRRFRTARGCIRALNMNKGNIRVISLDYNLGAGQPKGYVVARHMVRKNIFPPVIVIHSNDSVGRMKMYRLLRRHKPRHVALFVRPLPSPC